VTNAFYGRFVDYFAGRTVMWFVVIGTLLILLKASGVALASLSWWWVLSPFPLAMVWWEWADKSGHTKRRAMDKLEARKEERRRKNLVNMGMDTPAGRPRARK
jgi:small Trp-rich protein